MGDECLLLGGIALGNASRVATASCAATSKEAHEKSVRQIVQSAQNYLPSVLTAHLDTPIVAETPVRPDLLQRLDVLTQLCGDHV